MSQSFTDSPPSQERVRRFVLDHFEWLAAGRLEDAPRQLVVLPGERMKRPLELYVRRMREIGPFDVTRVAVSECGVARVRERGYFATIWVEVDVVSALGRRTARLPVWWHPEDDRLLVGTRLTHWTLDALASGLVE